MNNKKSFSELLLKTCKGLKNLHEIRTSTTLCNKKAMIKTILENIDELPTVKKLCVDNSLLEHCEDGCKLLKLFTRRIRMNNITESIPVAFYISQDNSLKKV